MQIAPVFHEGAHASANTASMQRKLLLHLFVFPHAALSSSRVVEVLLVVENATKQRWKFTKVNQKLMRFLAPRQWPKL
jgi:hypothetical protein